MQIKRSNKPTDPTTMWVYNPTPFVITAHFGADKVGGVDVVFQPGDAKKYYEDFDEQGQRVLVPIPNYAAKLMTTEEHWGKEGLILVNFEDEAFNLIQAVRVALNRAELTWRTYWRTLDHINSQRREKNQLAMTEKDWVCTDATHPEWHLRPWIEIAKEHLEAIAKQREINERKLLRVNMDKVAGQDERELQYQNQVLLEQQKRVKADEALEEQRQLNRALQAQLASMGHVNKDHPDKKRAPVEEMA